MAIVEASISDFEGKTFIGNGTDTLKLVGDGVFWLNKATIRGFAEIVTNDRANIVIDAAQLAGISAFSSNYYGYGFISIFGRDVDLQSVVSIGDFSVILETDGATVRARNSAQALQVFSRDPQNDTIFVQEYLSLEDRNKLHANGFDTVTDTVGSSVNTKPVISNLDQQRIKVSKGQSGLIDPQSDALIVDDDGAISEIELGITSSNISLIQEIVFGSNFRMAGSGYGATFYYKEESIGRVEYSADRMKFIMSSDISRDIAHEFIRGLSYKPSNDKIYTTSTELKISVTDPGGRSSSATIFIDIKDPVHSSTGNYINKGNSKKNYLFGGSDNEIFYPGKGNDFIKTGGGKDIIVFNSSPSKGNRDQISDFSVKNDTIWLDNAVFKKLGKKGSEDKPAKLNKKFFTIGEAAKDKNDYLIYNKKTGMLSYDSDGSGSKKAVEIANLSKKLKMTDKDFFVV